jgi:predicted RNase H-like HicB family nuclease
VEIAATTLTLGMCKISTIKTTRELTAIIEREGNGYVSLCPELDVASQGYTVELARANLIEALELFFETASPAELGERMHDEVLITRVKVAV